jgi:quinol monooxygenase YgiN
MSVRVIAELHVKPEATEQVKSGFNDLFVDTRAFDGCEEISLVQSQDDPNMFLLLEQWETRESHEAYLKWRTDRGDMDNIAGVSTEPFKISYFDYVRA